MRRVGSTPICNCAPRGAAGGQRDRSPLGCGGFRYRHPAGQPGLRCYGALESAFGGPDDGPAPAVRGWYVLLTYHRRSGCGDVCMI